MKPFFLLVVALFAASCVSAPSQERAAAPVPAPQAPVNNLLTARTYFKGEARALLERYLQTKDDRDGTAFRTYCENTPQDEWMR